MIRNTCDYYGRQNSTAHYLYCIIRNYSKIPSTQPACDQVDFEVLNILDYQAYLYCPKFLQEMFVYCSCKWAVQLIRRYLLHLLVQSHQDHLCFLESSQLNWLPEKEAGDMTTVHIQTLLKALSDMSHIACFIDEAFFFFFKAKLPVLGLLSSDYWES